MSTIKVKKEYEPTTAPSCNHDKNIKSAENNSFEPMSFEEMNTYNGMEKALERMKKFHEMRNGLALSLYLKVLSQVQYNFIRSYCNDIARLLDDIFNEKASYNDFNIKNIVRHMRQKLFDNLRREHSSGSEASSLNDFRNKRNSFNCRYKRPYNSTNPWRNNHCNAHCGVNYIFSPSPIKRKKVKDGSINGENRYRRTVNDKFRLEFKKYIDNSNKPQIMERLPNSMDPTHFNELKRRNRGYYGRKNRNNMPYAILPIDKNYIEAIPTKYKEVNSFIYKKILENTHGTKFTGKGIFKTPDYVEFVLSMEMERSSSKKNFSNKNSLIKLRDLTPINNQSKENHVFEVITRKPITMDNRRSSFTSDISSANSIIISKSKNGVSPGYLVKREANLPKVANKHLNNLRHGTRPLSPINNTNRSRFNSLEPKTHGLKVTDCKYYKHRRCRFGLQCNFLHGIEPTVGYRRAQNFDKLRRSRSYSYNRY
uniref:C3H1-type domain-containing protein n=1 Tax=Strongyloides venezuelensis TaxID=75913 RepID=A0A0K0FIA0_STRVS